MRARFIVDDVVPLLVANADVARGGLDQVECALIIMMSLGSVRQS